MGLLGSVRVKGREGGALLYTYFCVEFALTNNIELFVLSFFAKLAVSQAVVLLG